jgi:hypothetical protein
MMLRRIGPGTVLLFLLASLPFLASTVSAATRDDGYVSGYAAAILEREFHLPAPSLRVQDGVIALDAADLKDADRAAVIEALSRIRGAVRVAIVETATAPAVQPVAPSHQPSTASAPHVAVAEKLQKGLFPGGQLFDPLIADPRWPHFGASYQRYLDDKQLKDVAAVSFGETFTVYRDELPLGWWEVGIQAGVFSLFDLDAASKDLINADYFVAGAVGYRYDRFSALGRVFHQSSHLGDEFLLRNRVKRVNLSYEGVDLKLSYDFFGDVLRAYAGGGYLFDRDPNRLKPGSLQWGLEFRSPWPGEARRFRPIAAIDVQNREQNDWHSDISVRAGLEFKGVLVTRNLQLLLEYFRGYSPNGQFYQEKIDYIGLGAHVHF